MATTGKAAFIELVNSMLLFGTDLIDETNCDIGLVSPATKEEAFNENYSFNYDINSKVTITAKENGPFVDEQTVFYNRLDLTKVVPRSIVVNFNVPGETSYQPTDQEFLEEFYKVTLLPIGQTDVTLSYNDGVMTLTAIEGSYVCTGSTEVTVSVNSLTDITTAINPNRMYNGY